MRWRSLRLRLLATFAVGALLLSSLFAVLTYVAFERVLVSNQQQTDLRQSFVNAALIRSTLYTSPPDLANQLNAIEQATNSSVLVHTHHQWLSKSHGAATADVTSTIIRLVDQGHVVQQTLERKGRLIFVVGVPIPAVETQVFEVFHLGRLNDTLRTLLTVLGLGALVTTFVGLAGGLWVARRTVRPLQRVSSAAAAIAEGDLTTRLDLTRPDLEIQQLTESFNGMVARLSDRLERDARFASDVSHELRSPLTTLATTTAVLQQHRDELSASGRASLDLLSADLAIFQTLIDDLLEMARSDAGASSPNLETVPVAELVRQATRRAAQRLGVAVPTIEVDTAAPSDEVAVDRRRFERVMANLMSNAQRYAHGVTAVRVHPDAGVVVIDVDDAGPGVPADERDRVFDRFFRGRAAHARGIAHGTGLGLALVLDHVTTLGGSVTILDSPEGGARVRIVLPTHVEVTA